MEATWAKLLEYLRIDEWKLILKAQLAQEKERKAKEKRVIPKEMRNKIKAKWKGFVTTFGKTAEEQKTFSVPDWDLRSSLRNDHIELIVDKYREFYELFKDIDFTKKKDKYFIFDVKTLETMINSFFDEEG